MKKILGLDLGTNSIGWAVVDAIKDESKQTFTPVAIDAAGSRIIPMDAAQLGDFAKGNTISQTKERTAYRGTRRLRERNLLRRERLHRVLDLMDFLPEHYAQKLNRYGKFTDESEPKLAWKRNDSGIFEFIFKDSFNEMLADFKQKQPLLTTDGKKVPYDWTIYYLRKKALTQKISKEELSWILLNFNQKRGYYQLRGEEEEDAIKVSKTRQYFDKQRIVDIIETGKEYKGLQVLLVELANGDKGKIFKKEIPNWIGQEKDIIVTIDLDKNGDDKYDDDGLLSCKFKIPSENEWDSEWKLIKVKTENDIYNSHNTVGAYIYDSLLQNPSQKIKGKLVRTIERNFYKNELQLILEKQKEFHPELKDKGLYNRCLNELYTFNEAHKSNVGNRDFTYLFIDDIIFYQRPLKSKKSLIDNCPYESGFDKVGKEHPIKCIAKSNPIYQEFRLWQFISNLRIFQREKDVNGKLETDVEVTNDFLKNEEDVVALFDWLNDRKEIKQDVLFGSFFKIKKPKGKEYPYRWNYVEDKEYPCNETRALFLSKLEKTDFNLQLLTREFEYALWHILYSVEDKQEIGKALNSFASKNQLSEQFVDALKKCPPFKKGYGAYSEKAIKKLLSLMRIGKYWGEDAIDVNTRQRIEKIITGEFDETINSRTRENIDKYKEKTGRELKELSQFSGLPIWLVCYVVYNRHSEAKEIEKWESPGDIDHYLKHFKQHSLRNPIVEQVITETLRTVRDIWKQVGRIDEIHVELGREMKQPAEDRAKITLKNLENEQTNLRIKALLTEFLNPEYNIDNVRSYSPSQQEILKIYEEKALGIVHKVTRNKEKKTSTIKIEYAPDVPTDIIDIVQKFKDLKQPSKTEFMRYKLWLEQKYCSPYTGEMIPLGKLFTSAYEIEHIIPQSRYFDDSFSNKVICETEVNKLKDNQLGYEFIKNHHGEKVTLNFGKIVEILTVEAYEKFVKNNYERNRGKMKKLLMDEIPDKFIERQLNDSRYISKVVKCLLSNIVREKDEQEAISKNVIPCNGSVTDRLKKDWGMNDVWNSIVLPRFERLNQLTGKNVFTTESNGHIIPSMPLELQKGFNKKRIDHRHHAMDAIVIACATRSHVNLLNNESARSENKTNRYQLSHKLRRYEKVVINGKEREVPKEFILPWDTFPQDAQSILDNIVVSFKQNLRVINKTINHYHHYNEKGKKILIRPTKEVPLSEALIYPKRILDEKFRTWIESMPDFDANAIVAYLKKNHSEFSTMDLSKIKVYNDGWAIRKQKHDKTFWAKVQIRKIREVSLSDALRNLQSIVEKELKKKLKDLLSKEYDEKKIKNYFEANKDIWADVNINKIKVYYFEENSATRFLSDLVSLFAGVKEEEKALVKIDKISDSGIQKILRNHLKKCDNNAEIAFSADGIDQMNRNIVVLNDGKYHCPIYKVRRYESLGKKFAVGNNGNKKDKYVEASSGTNLFFAVYQSKTIDKETGEEKMVRSYTTVPLNISIDRQKRGLPPVPDINENGDTLLFWLSPNDLVYLLTKSDLRNGTIAQPLDNNRVYLVNDFNGGTIYFKPSSFAKALIDNEVDMKFDEDKNKIIGSYSDKTASIDGIQIKDICVPLKVDRLGNIVELNGKEL